MAKRRVIVAGQRFRMLVTVSKSNVRDKYGSFLWLCRCDCGNEKLVTPTRLGRVRACGCRLRKKLVPLVDRFWDKIDKSAGPDGCWLWAASANVKGYGQFAITGSDRVDGRRRMMLAHRMAYLLSKGPIPDGLLVMHSCDCPPCCNPRHLSVGTPYENTHDAINKKRPIGRPRR